MTNSKDLFDNNAMSFGDHLETLRIHLWKSIIGLIACCIFTLLFSGNIIGFIRGPIDRALQEHGKIINDDISEFNLYDYVHQMIFEGDEENSDDPGIGENGSDSDSENEVAPEDEVEGEYTEFLVVNIEQVELEKALHKIDPKKYPAPAKRVKENKKPADNEEKSSEEPKDPDQSEKKDELEEEEFVSIKISAPLFQQMKKVIGDQSKPVVLTVQEPFMTYLKVALVSGLVMSSPWIFYQIWLFVAAGLYPHEQKYVYRYLPMSLGLFFGGAFFCFYLVFPFILDFLLGFADLLGVNPQIRLSEWISFALMLPFMFGLSFQLPIVMLLLERISIFSADDYREKRRLAVLVIAVISMLMTPADPMSMVMMMFPLTILYECGILLCGKVEPPESPFEEADAF